MKIVIDTNVIASAVFFGGKPRQLLELLFQRKVDAYASPEMNSTIMPCKFFLQLCDNCIRIPCDVCCNCLAAYAIPL